MSTKTKTLQDHKGFDIPVRVIPKLDLTKHKAAERLYKKGQALHEKLKEFKELFFETLDEIYKEDADENGVIGKGKGNYTITTYDKGIKLSISVSDHVSFDNKIEFAQEKLNDFLALKTKNVDNDLALIVNNAFKTSKGRLDAKRIFELFSYNIKHPLWVEAIDLIRASIQVDHSKRYPQIYERNDNGEYKPLSLNLSSI